MVKNIRIVVSPTLISNCRITLGVEKDHSKFENLDYEHSGHTGFASQEELLSKLDKDNFGWVIADNTYNPTFSYNKGDTVYYVDKVNPHRGYLYVAKVNIPAPAGEFDYTKWETTTLERLIWYKQDKLIAGSGISINGSTISSTIKVEVVETGALVKKLYSEISQYKLVFLYGYRDALDAPNQFMFAFMPDQLQVDGEDLQFLAQAGSNNWQYPIRIKRHSDGYVYWWSAYDYGGNTRFYVTKIIGVK